MATAAMDSRRATARTASVDLLVHALHHESPFGKSNPETLEKIR